jgi:hypothetical protein
MPKSLGSPQRFCFRLPRIEAGLYFFEGAGAL